MLLQTGDTFIKSLHSAEFDADGRQVVMLAEIHVLSNVTRVPKIKPLHDPADIVGHNIRRWLGWHTAVAVLAACLLLFAVCIPLCVCAKRRHSNSFDEHVQQLQTQPVAATPASSISSSTSSAIPTHNVYPTNGVVYRYT